MALRTHKELRYKALWGTAIVGCCCSGRRGVCLLVGSCSCCDGRHTTGRKGLLLLHLKRPSRRQSVGLLGSPNLLLLKTLGLLMRHIVLSCSISYGVK